MLVFLEENLGTIVVAAIVLGSGILAVGSIRRKSVWLWRQLHGRLLRVFRTLRHLQKEKTKQNKTIGLNNDLQ